MTMTDDELRVLRQSVSYGPDWETHEPTLRFEAEIARREVAAIKVAPPAGFAAVFDYDEYIFPKQDESVFVHDDTQCYFYVNQLPVLPLRLHGSFLSLGQEGETQYVVDNNRHVWVGYDQYMHRRDAAMLLDLDMPENQRNLIREAVGLKPHMPVWMRSALDAGWTPPAQIDFSLYEGGE